jgi:hypothetical protein
MNDFSHHYAILRVTHDTDWNTLRARYKRLIGRWHPDRFASDAPERVIAEEQSKQITIAYQALERYYRDHGVLPRIEPAMPAGEPRSVAPEVEPASESAGRATTTAKTGATERYPAAQAPGWRPRAFIVLSVLIVGVYAAYRYPDLWLSGPDAAADGNRDLDAPTPEPRARETPSETGGITAGSTLGDVYAIQGIPTLTQGDTWYYGKSQIHFAQGKVVSWTQHPDNPLRIARDQPVELREGYFDVGSTKDDVRSIQGTPVTESETVWDYGPSRVYFENNRVVRWEASPLQPLRVSR